MHQHERGSNSQPQCWLATDYSSNYLEHLATEAPISSNVMESWYNIRYICWEILQSRQVNIVKKASKQSDKRLVNKVKNGNSTKWKTTRQQSEKRQVNKVKNVNSTTRSQRLRDFK